MGYVVTGECVHVHLPGEESSRCLFRGDVLPDGVPEEQLERLDRHDLIGPEPEESPESASTPARGSRGRSSS